jgi:hypothetical protein
MNYKKFSNKFELPIIKNKVPLVINRKMDTSPYDRVFNCFIILYDFLFFIIL